MCKILMEELHGIGDVVCDLPRIKCITERFPDAQIDVLVKFGANRDIIRASRLPVRDIYALNVYSFRRETYEKIAALRRKRYDYLVLAPVTSVMKARVFRWLLNPVHVMGLQEHGIYADSLEDTLHFVDAGMKSVGGLEKKRDYSRKPQLYPAPEDVAKIKKSLQIKPDETPLVGVCIGDADVSYRYPLVKQKPVFTRGWGYKNVMYLIKNLLQKNYCVAMIGGKMEKDRAQKIWKTLGEQDYLFDFAGNTTLAESIALASLCDCMVGVDTGMQHVAGALGVPTVSIFGPTNPQTHGAYAANAHFVTVPEHLSCQFCYGTRNYVGCDNRRCLSGISVASVLEQIQHIVPN